MTDNLPPAYGGKRAPQSAPAKPQPANPWLVGLIIMGVLALVGAGVLGIALGSTRYDAGPTSAVTLATWSNFLLLAAVILFAAAAVVGGVEWALRHAGFRA